jgi:hypothetical protein
MKTLFGDVSRDPLVGKGIVIMRLVVEIVLPFPFCLGLALMFLARARL